MTNENQTAGKKQRKLGLTSVILIALALGIVCGVIFHYIIPAGTVRDDIFVNGVFYVVGQGFIRLMQMLVVPLVFCSIVCGIYRRHEDARHDWRENAHLLSVHDCARYCCRFMHGQPAQSRARRRYVLHSGERHLEPR